MSSPIEKLTHSLSQLPGIGEKTAMRLAFFILKSKPSYAQELSSILADLHSQIRFCERCQNLTQTNPCGLCANAQRNPKVILVVETPQDMMAMEKSRSFKGSYHILHGALSPLEGIGPEDLKITQLLSRILPDAVEEVILGTNPNVEGEATALYLAKLLLPLQIRVTRLASGMPVGGGIEYLDPLTLQKALEGRLALV